MKYLFLISVFLFVFFGIKPTKSEAAPISYVISTFKNGKQVGARKVNVGEIHAAASALNAAFQNESAPQYEQLFAVTKTMTAKERCFNLYASRSALASIETGIFDASANAEEFLNNSIRTIEDVNIQTQVTCQMK